jgi:hypothetical protein
MPRAQAMRLFIQRNHHCSCLFQRTLREDVSSAQAMIVSQAAGT